MKIIMSSIFDSWLENLKDKRAQRVITYAITRCEAHGQMIGDIKPVGDKVYEMRFFFDSGYRVYYTQIGSLTVYLLAGGDKSTQRKDIKKAKQLAFDIHKGNQS